MMRKRTVSILVEYADSQGIEYVIAILKADEILVLQYELAVS